MNVTLPFPGLDETTDRRSFLQRAALLGTATGVLAGCAREDERPAAGQADTTAHAQHPGGPVNNDDAAGAGTQPPSQGQPALKPDAAYRRYDPTLPPVAPGAVVNLQMTVRELNLHIARDVVVPAWTFNGTVPGPVVHVRQGQTVNFTLTNQGKLPHSMDFHAAQVNPKEAFRSIVPGQQVQFSFTPKYAGAFMYHCGTQPVLLHIGSGMYGAIIVDPPSPLPPAKEFVLVQSEFYVGKDGAGHPTLDYQRMMSTMPDYVCFNGIAGQYQAEPIVVQKGDRVRFHVVSAGPTHPCNFHIVGEQFDVVYLGAPPGNPLRGVQTFSVPPGGGMVFELDCDIPGEFPFVNHGFGHGQKGAIGILVVQS
ncbi:multicopper oxidase domain-containing protein [Longimicrobium sp.]|uniref:multicopper oxidase domain-containing protein n=1 Tax=Longimicrobium sp. TaxID=2029185 RepID=UPI002CE825AB|nr:multicopper oxidase domain-containing protein [Longimicrobium sp.]HSU16574.1 multicopper oxidase domain-containing protein [Longimicrobium sp.]